MQPHSNVALLSRHFGPWSLDFCRVIYVWDRQSEDGGAVQRTRFALWNFAGHAVRGEEIFSIEWHTATQKVWYEIFSFSRPANLLIELRGPLARSAQRRLAAASVLEALRRCAE
jgi:uncharacterized protein (UPF0548 family)